MIPTRRELGHCRDCRRLILWTITDLNKRMPVDPEPDPEGNQAVWRDGPRIWRARSLDGRGAPELREWEDRFKPHFATCPARQAQMAIPGLATVTRLDDRRRAQTRTPHP
ncbi:hypothetical protein [Planobispora longispora]|uniref:Uncharacterized protein n=1 Tax=Planobispora longispora TaxID=28887 RepID=A0A8J3RI49_9ACTN|nr:hypothetical protein [Planobispora longispora]BFE85804.1 hypothetical protein GCM10020093_084050 [Planobispora longispora]GIH76162.1 hypothetical protein Plo01_25910 [Planobispora longispora]